MQDSSKGTTAKNVETLTDRKKVVNEIMKKGMKAICAECEDKDGKQTIDVCYNCPVHKMVNDIVESLN